MAKAQRKIRRVRVPAFADGPTPERLAKGDLAQRIESPESDGRKNRNAVQTVVRLVVSKSIDHLYYLGSLSWAQWHAGCTYRELMQDAWPEPNVCADYGTRVGSGGNDGYSPVPLTEKAERARAKLRLFRDGISLPHRQAIEAAITGEHRDERGRARMNRLACLKEALQAAAVVLKVA